MMFKQKIEKYGLFIVFVAAISVGLISLASRRIDGAIEPLTAYSFYFLESLQLGLLCQDACAHALLFISNIVLLVLFTGMLYMFVKDITDAAVALYASLLFVASPVFIFYILQFSWLPLAAVLTLLAFMISYATFKDRKAPKNAALFWVKSGTIVMLIIIVYLLDHLHGVTAAVAVLGQALVAEYDKRRRVRPTEASCYVRSGTMRFVLPASVLCVIALFCLLGRTDKSYVLLTDIGFFARLRGDIGLSVVLLLFAFAGYIEAVYQRRKALKNTAVIFVLLGLLYIAWQYQTTLIITTALFAMLGGMLIRKLESRSWTLETLRFMTFLLMFCVVLFSTVSYLNELELAHPDKDLIEIRGFIKDFETHGRIFAAPQEGYVLGPSSGIYPTIWQAYTPQGDVHEELLEFMDRRLLADVTPLLDAQGISLIVVPKDTKDDIFWDEGTERGLRFVMLNSKRFTLLHATQEHEIWLYIPREPR